MTNGLRDQRRRQILGHLAHQYAPFDHDEPAVYLVTGDTVWATLDRVTPEVAD